MSIDGARRPISVRGERHVLDGAYHISKVPFVAYGSSERELGTEPQQRGPSDVDTQRDGLVKGCISEDFAGDRQIVHPDLESGACAHESAGAILDVMAFVKVYCRVFVLATVKRIWGGRGRECCNHAGDKQEDD